MTTKLRPFLPFLALAATAALSAADEPAGQPAPPTAAPNAVAKPADDGVVTLPAVQVTRSRIRQIDVTIKRIDKLIGRERKHLKSTDTDRAMNNDKVAGAAALFGGYSTGQREAVAAERVRLLESERELLEQMKAPMTREDFIVVEKQIELLRTARRELDVVYR